MIQWTYNAADFNPNRFKLIPPGKYRVRIEEAEEQTSKTGKQMVKLTLKVSGYNSTIWHYVVFDMTTPEGITRTNDRLGWIYDSFSIQPGNLDVETWKGKAGAAEIINEDNNKGGKRAVVKNFILRKDQSELPAWQDSTAHTSPQVNSEMVNFEDGGMPF
ncbi:MAG: DUF669 domain-containing protein [Synergistaceae bacterium]|nr:DUF669 domain-containing protein [Synergistaceae bacterium]MBQ3585765.1 DUF669 domain-containing protein [Synergistaceae bacterium]MBQ6113901.1 DUF669 domain-containing protein [Synergistaceae bacterium]MBR0249294.1 DUF669 domain-containing protein [Synergistaceae bacterium]